MLARTKTLERISAGRLAVGAALGGVLAVIIALALTHQTSTATPALPAGQPDAVQPIAPSMVLVFVSGAVANPGLYRVSSAARVADAIAASGGLTSTADPGRIPNLSALVHDGRQINVPFLKGTSSVAKLDINSAGVDELSAIPGMPAGLPQAITEFRDEWGGFLALSQLHTELGVDAATVAGLRLYLRMVAPALAR